VVTPCEKWNKLRTGITNAKQFVQDYKFHGSEELKRKQSEALRCAADDDDYGKNNDREQERAAPSSSQIKMVCGRK